MLLEVPHFLNEADSISAMIGERMLALIGIYLLCWLVLTARMEFDLEPKKSFSALNDLFCFD